MMKKPIAIILGVLTLSGASVVTFNHEFYSRYHYDTLREERFKLTKVLGIPIWKEARQVVDIYPDSYTLITGLSPDPKRWRNMPWDYRRSLVGGMYRCFGTPFPLRERNELLETLYSRFSNGMSRDEALRTFERIDRITPGDRVRDEDIDINSLDELRDELGLERRFTIGAEQNAAGQSDTRPLSK